MARWLAPFDDTCRHGGMSGRTSQVTDATFQTLSYLEDEALTHSIDFASRARRVFAIIPRN